MKTLLLIQIGLRSRLPSCKGQTMTEYALILAAVAMIAYAGFEAIGSTTLAGVLDEIVEELR